MNAPAVRPSPPPLLEVRDLRKTFPMRRSIAALVRRQPTRRLVAVDDVSFDLQAKVPLGVVGESGSGKSTLARCLVRLEEPDDGEIRFDGVDVRSADRATLRLIRRRVQLVFQDPYSSLNPRLTVGSAIAEPSLVHGLVARGDADDLVIELLERVGLPPSAARRRPRELSGGQRQRVAIARALAVRPSLIVADEAVSALDVSIQAQILNLFDDLVTDLDLSLIFISHQLAVVAHIARRVAIMYLGRIVEIGPTSEVFSRPRHPYTAALLASHPRPEEAGGREIAAIGELPSPLAIPSGCRYHSRCPYAEPRCRQVDPHNVEVGPDHRVACHVMPTDLRGVE